MDSTGLLAILRRSVQRVAGTHLRDLAYGKYTSKNRRNGGEPQIKTKSGIINNNKCISYFPS